MRHWLRGNQGPRKLLDQASEVMAGIVETILNGTGGSRTGKESTQVRLDYFIPQDFRRADVSFVEQWSRGYRV